MTVPLQVTERGCASLDKVVSRLRPPIHPTNNRAKGSVLK